MSRRNIIVLLICLAATGVRCWKINAPFTDSWSWRQSDVAAIARNYSETGFHFARPQIDWAGDQPGYVGTEFPILPFVAALAYKALGVHEWIGRAETIILFVFSLPFFFGIVRAFFDETTAVFALVFYCFAPLSVAAGRAFMPDMPSLALALAGLYFFQRALATFRYAGIYFLVAAVLTSLALLIKIPTVTIAAPIASLAWRKFGWDMFRQINLWLFAAIVLLPSLIWYWHAHELAERFYPYHFFGGGGVRVMDWRSYWRILVQTFFSTLTPGLFVLATVGIVLSWRNPEVAPFCWWLLATILFIVIVGYGNRHQWYQLPLVPIAAVFGSVAVSLMAKKQSLHPVLVGIVVLFLAGSFIASRNFFASPAEPLWQLGRALRDHTSNDALIIAADNGDPTALYYAHRKGWHFLQRHGLYYGNPVDSAQILLNLQELRQRGATHLVFYSGTTWWLNDYTAFAEELTRRSVLEDATANYRIYRLTQ